METLKILQSFVLGQLAVEDFERLLLSSETVKQCLEDHESLLPYADANGLYLYLISSNLSSPGGLLNAKDAVSRFLLSKGIEAPVPVTAAAELKLKIAVLPKWVSMPDALFEAILKKGAPRTGKALESWLRQEVKSRFVCLGKPPRWLQAPDWQFDEIGPMIFVGQLDVTALRHDTCWAYVFLSQVNGKYKVIEQSA